MRWPRFLTVPRAPDFIIGPKDDPYLLRWHLLPRNRWFSIYLHRFLKSDDDRALHDHPYYNASILLRGRYLEHLPAGTVKQRRAGQIVVRSAVAAHRIELLPGSKAVWTLFVTGPRIREWGFLCPRGWVHWKDFTDARDGGLVGKGCNE